MKIRVLLFIMLLVFCFSISACTDDPGSTNTPPVTGDIPVEKKDVDMSGVSFRSYNFVYDGTEKQWNNLFENEYEREYIETAKIHFLK